jgi:cytochrome c5
MKYIISTVMILILTACGGEKKAQQIIDKYTYITPTVEILESGKATFDKYCYICHNEGIGGAAMLTDKVRWEENRAKDLDLLVQHVYEGYTGKYGTMTPMGTCMECSKDDLRDAILYMMKEAEVL